MTPMKIIQINKFDRVGGAASIASSLHRSYLDKQHPAKMLVDRRLGVDDSIEEINNDLLRNSWTQFWLSRRSFYEENDFRFLRKMSGGLARLGEISRWINIQRGLEDYCFPGSRAKVDGFSTDSVIHFHNLHNDYFDLRLLKHITKRRPAVVTLHDEWLFTGHCAGTFECDRWQVGCGSCPDLFRYPAVCRDATAENFLRKKSIYQQSRLYVTAPSSWLLDRARRSILKHAAVGWQVIPNGVDLEVFRPGDSAAARKRLGLPENAFICLFVGVGTRTNPYKDYQTMRAAVEISAQSAGEQQITFLAVGEEGPDETVGRCRVLHMGSVVDRTEMADYFRAADIYLHAARSENFPTTILEAMACGTPVVATAVGGIPEQIEDGITGFLIPEGDAEAMANKINVLAENEPFRAAAGSRAVEKAGNEFDLRLMASRYLDLYKELLESYPSDDRESSGRNE